MELDDPLFGNGGPRVAAPDAARRVVVRLRPPRGGRRRRLATPRALPARAPAPASI
jgi:hypothetical protein